MALAGRRGAEAMPTKRRKIPPLRINQPVPAWVPKLLASEPLEIDSEAWAECVGWKFFDEPVAGLPDPMSAEGRALWAVRDAD